MNSFIFALFISLFGLGYLMYGKRAGRTIAMISGIGLMVFPYFVSDLLWMAILTIFFLALPFVWRR